MLWQLFKRKDMNYENNKEYALNNKKVINTVYGKEPQDKQTRRFYFVHFILKYKILLPALLLFDKLFGKRMVKTTPDKPQFSHVKMFERAYDGAVIDWATIYLNLGRKVPFTEETAKEIYKTNQGSTFHFLRLIKEIMLTITTNDDAYLDFIPFFFTKIYFEMEKEMKLKKPYLIHNVGGVMTLPQEKFYLALTKKIEEGKIKYQVVPCGIQKSSD